MARRETQNAADAAALAKATDCAKGSSTTSFTAYETNGAVLANTPTCGSGTTTVSMKKNITFMFSARRWESGRDPFRHREVGRHQLGHHDPRRSSRRACTTRPRFNGTVFPSDEKIVPHRWRHAARARVGHRATSAGSTGPTAPPVPSPLRWDQADPPSPDGDNGNGRGCPTTASTESTAVGIGSRAADPHLQRRSSEAGRTPPTRSSGTPCSSSPAIRAETRQPVARSPSARPRRGLSSEELHPGPTSQVRHRQGGTGPAENFGAVTVSLYQLTTISIKQGTTPQ